MTLIDLAGGRAELGFWLMTPNDDACAIASVLGYGTAIVDMEHGAFDPAGAARIITVCKALRLRAFVRVESAERVPVQHGLDFGADGVILPQIADVDHARVATAFAKYPPLGTRGFGGGKTVRYLPAPRHFVEAENRRVSCWAMIETTSALRDVDEIARLETVDGLFVGPNDLSLARGRGEYSADSRDRADIGRIAEAAQKAGKPWAMPTDDRQAVEFARRLGAAFLAVTDDRTAMRQGFEIALKEANA
jgi:2-dehydro-3-deoxyglucarate aldolase